MNSLIVRAQPSRAVSVAAGEIANVHGEYGRDCDQLVYCCEISFRLTRSEQFLSELGEEVMNSLEGS